MDEVKKNITTFFGILKIGKTESVIHWDESNFKRAEQWARYAEEVYKKVKNKPSLIQALVNYTRQHQSEANNESVVFDSLKDARETLRRILLQNPHLSSAQFSLVLDMYEVDFLSPPNKNLEVLICDTFHIIHHKGIFTTLSTINDELSNHLSSLQSENMNGDIQYKCSENIPQCKSSIQPTVNICLDVVGKLLLQDLRNMEKQKDGDLNDDYFEKKLKSIADQKKGIEILLRMVLISIDEDSSASGNIVLDPLKLRVLFWVADHCLTCATNDRINGLWSCPSTLLCSVSFMHPPFCKSYLDFLKSHGDRLCGRRSVDMINSDNVNDGCSYQELVQRFQQLLQGPERISELCRNTLRSWIVVSECETHISSVSVNFWKKIHQELCL